MARSMWRCCWILLVCGLLAGGPAVAEIPAPVLELREAAGLPQFGARDALGHRLPTVEMGTLSNRSLTRGAGPSWVGLGPLGGQVDDVAQSPTNPLVMLAATVRGAYRSADGGLSWSRIGVPGSDTFAAAFASDGTAFVGGFDGLWRSTDDAQSFNEVIPFGNIILSIVVDPNDDDIVWASTSFQGTTSSVFRSTDAGLSWSDVGPNLGSDCTDLAVDPTDSNTVFATFGGFGGGGAVWSTSDGGTTWNDRSAGLPDIPVQTVAFTDSQVIVGGGELFGSQAFGLYASNNGGMTWTPLHDGSWPLLVVRDLSIDPNDDQTLVVATDGTGIHRSTDGGATWEISVNGTANLALRSVAHGPGSSSDLSVGAASRGILRSSDGGSSFASSNSGLGLLDVQAVAANPLDPQELAVAYNGLNDGGLFTTTDGGANWVEEPVPATRWDGVEFDPAGVLYATSDGPTTVGVEGLYRREPGGAWTSLGPFQGPLFETDVSVIRFVAGEPDTLLLAGSDTNLEGGDAVIWRSLDRGASWTKVYETGSNQDGQFRDLDIAEATTEGADPVMVAVRWFGVEGGVARSTDGGATWTESSTGIPVGSDPSGLCLFPGTTGPFYLADRGLGLTDGGVWRSDDDGQSWQLVGLGGAVVQDISCAADGALYITQIFGVTPVFRSDDGGATFTPFIDGLEEAGVVRFLDVDPGSGSRLLYGAFSGSYAANLDVLLFADGFESGDLNAWSSASP